jgi:hypothetical protein
VKKNSRRRSRTPARFEILNETVAGEVAALPADLQPRFLRLAQRIAQVRLHEEGAEDAAQRDRTCAAAILVADAVGDSRLAGAEEERTLAPLSGLRTIPFDKLKARLLADPTVRAEYDALEVSVTWIPRRDVVVSSRGRHASVRRRKSVSLAIPHLGANRESSMGCGAISGRLRRPGRPASSFCSAVLNLRRVAGDWAICRRAAAVHFLILCSQSVGRRILQLWTPFSSFSFHRTAFSKACM